MRIKSIREREIPVAAEIRNAYVDFSTMSASRQRTRHGSRDVLSSTTNATLSLWAILRNFWLFDMR